MLEMIKKIFSVLSALPNFSKIFQSASKTGKISPVETLEVLSNISPGTKKVSDTAMNELNRGADIPQVVQAITNVGEIDVFGQKIDTRTLIPDLRRAGGICSVMANMLEKMKNQTPQNIVEFGEAASSISNWSDLVNQEKKS